MIALKKLILVALVLILGTLACMINLGGPAYPTPSIPVSTEAVESLEQTIHQAIAAGADTGTLTLAITETQLTSYLALKLQLQSSPIITFPQVYLRDGQIRIYGTATQGYFQVTASIILTAGIDSAGQLQIELSSADFGPMPVPQEVNDALSTVIKEAFTGSLGPVATGLRLDSVTIADGIMVIVGRTK
jgi:hypothetical protein